MKETELIDEIHGLPHAIKPQRDLWPGVYKRLAPIGRTSGFRVTTSFWRIPALAAAMMLALTTGIFIGHTMDAPPVDLAQQSVLEFALMGAREATEREYQAAFRELVSLDYSGIRIASENPDALRGSWKDLQQAETALLAALRQYPSNIYLSEKLFDLRSQQLQFIKHLALLEQNNWRQT